MGFFSGAFNEHYLKSEKGKKITRKQTVGNYGIAEKEIEEFKLGFPNNKSAKKIINYKKLQQKLNEIETSIKKY
jgi:hypothetical protein